MGSELTKAGYSNMNAHQTIYVVTPEHTTGSQLIFRENTAPMIQDKHVLVLAASVTTGYTVQGAVGAIRRRACRCDRYLCHGGRVRRVSRGQHF